MIYRILQTKYPVAIDSPDYLHPWGTIRDNTMNSLFWEKIESVLENPIRFLDLGCAGGGLVVEALLRGHQAVGLEGSDYWIQHIDDDHQSAKQWKALNKVNLFTCDVSRPFFLSLVQTNEEEKTIDVRLEEFNLITMWEVIEHIPEHRLPFLFENLKNHLTSGGIFVGTISTVPDNPEGFELHQTVRPVDWWIEKFQRFGFEFEDLCLKEVDQFPRAEANSVAFQMRKK